VPFWRAYRSQYNLAWALAMLGDYSKAIEVIDKDWMLSPNSPRWIDQAASLLRADIYQMCGEPRTALRVATPVLHSADAVPTNGATSGGLSRWLALSIDAGCAPDFAWNQLRQSVAAIDDFDLLDQAEISTAWVWINERRGSDPGGHLIARRDWT